MSFLLPSVQAQEVEKSDGEDAPVKLSPLAVTSSGNTGYGAQVLTSSSRLNLRYIDVPQTVSVMTSEFLKDAYIFDSRDFAKYVNNVYPRSNGHDPSFFIRGLQITHSYVDGFLTSLPLSRDSALYDRTEYVKGPAAASLGRGEAGGLINYITKSPLTVNRTTLGATVGTDAFYRGEIDYNLVLSAEKKMAVRVPAYWEDADATRGGYIQHTKKYGVGPSFSWEVTPNTQLLVNAASIYYQGPGNVGEMWFSNPDIYTWLIKLGAVNASDWKPFGADRFVPDKNIYGLPGKGRMSDSYHGTMKLTHKFNDVVSVRLGSRWDKYDEDYRRFLLSPNVTRDPNRPDDFLVFFTYSRNLAEAEGIRTHGDLMLEGTLLGASHQLLGGFELANIETRQQAGSRGGMTQNLYNPSYAPPADFNPETVPTTSNFGAETDSFGYYAQYTGSAFNNRLKVNASWRADDFEVDNRNFRNNVRSTTETSTSVPRFSVAYKPVDSMTIYAVRSHQEDPPVTRNRYGGWRVDGGAVVPPLSDPRYSETFESQVTAKLDELGLKTSMLDNRVTMSFAVFQLERNGFVLNASGFEKGSNGLGQVTYDIFYTVSGEDIRGFELEVFGQPTKRLTLMAAYASQDGSKPTPTGAIVSIESLIDSMTFNGKYDFRNQAGNGFQVTFGGKYWFKGWNVWPGIDQRFSKDQHNIDLGASYHWKDGRYSAAFRVNNLTDQTVFMTPNSQWAFRRIFFSVSSRF